MADQLTEQDLPNVQVDGSELLKQNPEVTMGAPLTLEDLTRLFFKHQHQGSDGSEALTLGKMAIGKLATSSAGDLTITHNLNVTPKYILIFAAGLSGSVQGVMSIGWAKGIASGDYDVIFSDYTSSSSTANRIVEVRSASGTSLTATITAITPTTFTLTWTLTGSMTCQFIWAAFA